MIYLQLFLSFLQIGAFSFGGGYAAMPLIQNQVVQLHSWLSQSEFTDLITISQMTPDLLPSIPLPSQGPALQEYRGLWLLLRLCSAILHFSYITGKDLSEIPEFKFASGRSEIPSPGSDRMIAAAGVTILVNAFWGESIASLTASQLYQISAFRPQVFFTGSLILLARFKMNPSM